MSLQLLGELRDAARGLSSVIAIGLILVGAAVVIRLSARFIRRGLQVRTDRFLDQTRRRTLQPLLESLVRYVVYIIALVMILRTLHIDTTAIVASAGVAGVAVGLGAQNLVRDAIAGFFLIAEGLIDVGDVITFDGRTGIVERISVRTTQIRTSDDVVWTIPNGRLEIFGNKRPRTGPTP